MSEIICTFAGKFESHEQTQAKQTDFEKGAHHRYAADGVHRLDGAIRKPYRACLYRARRTAVDRH